MQTGYINKLNISLSLVTFVLQIFVLMILLIKIAEGRNVKMFEFYFSGSPSTPHDYHYHDFYEIFFLLSGENKSFFIEDKTYITKTNDLIFIQKDLLHKSNFVSQEYKRIVIHFSNDYVDNDIILQMESLFSSRIYTPENPEAVKKHIMGIANETGKKDVFSEHLVKLNFLGLLAYCARNKSEYFPSPSNPAVERLVKHINNNLHNKLSLQQAAEMLKMSEGHLSRLFVKNTGFSFREYITIVRIKNAKQLLRDTKKPIHQVADECGFNDSNYFSTVFKDATGLSPLEYRRTLESQSRPSHFGQS